MLVHAEPLRMRTNVVYFWVIRRLYRREWNWLCNCVNHIFNRRRGHGEWQKYSNSVLPTANFFINYNFVNMRTYAWNWKAMIAPKLKKYNPCLAVANATLQKCKCNPVPFLWLAFAYLAVLLICLDYKYYLERIRYRNMGCYSTMHQTLKIHNQCQWPLLLHCHVYNCMTGSQAPRHRASTPAEPSHGARRCVHLHAC